MKKPIKSGSVPLPEYPKLAFTLGPQVVCLESLPQVRQQASALAGQPYKALIQVIVTQRRGHLRGDLTNAGVPQHIVMHARRWTRAECLRAMRATARATAATMMVIGAVVHSQRRSSSSGCILVPDRMRPYIDFANLCPKVGSFGTRWRLFF